MDVRCKSAGVSYTFPVEAWLADDGKNSVRREIPARKLATGKPIEYLIEIQTSDCKHAATSAPVTMTLFGARGETGVFPLDNPLPQPRAAKSRLSLGSFKKAKKFERGGTESFIVTAPDVTPVKRMKISTDGSDGWHLATVICLIFNVALTLFQGQSQHPGP